jgi:hypothetical protein
MGKVFNKILKPVNKGMSSIFGDELGSALTMAGIAALAVYGGGAALGAMSSAGIGGSAVAGTAAGTAGSAAAAAGGSAAAAGGSAALFSGTGAMTALAGATGGYQQGAAKVAAEKQEAAQMDAQRRADEALRQQELTRKRALLAEQTGLAARSNSARNVRNTLQGLASSKLGSTEDKLGGA